MKSRILFLFVVVLFLFLSGEEAFAQWGGISQLKYTSIKCLLTVNDSTVFLAGDNGTFLRSTDNGTTWANVMQNGIEVDTLLSLGKGGGYIFAGANGLYSVYRSSDNGNSWSTANQGLPPIAVVNAFTWIDSTLYAATNYGVFSSTDNGGHWKADTAGLDLNQDPLYPINPYGGIVGITSVGSKKLYAIKSSSWGGVYASSADSIAWISIGLETDWGHAIAAIDTNVFVGAPGGIYLYTGSGTTWLSRSNGLPNNGQSCILTTADTLLFAYYTGFSNKGIYMSSDFGQTWVQINDSIFSGNVVKTMVTTKKYLIAGTQSGAWRLPLASVITSVNDIPIHLPTDYALSQNYPNPFNPSTTISFTLPSRSFVSLKVFDLLGREEATIVSEELSAGTHLRKWNAADMSSGVYFYRLQAGKYVEIKKLIFLK
jgi:photosystem II stability/assembly factor-like uncharacterized protein